MKCPHCHSENVQVQSKECKPKFAVPFAMVGAGIGLMIVGVIGIICGAVIGAIVGTIVNSILPPAYDSIICCQDCGAVTPMK